MYIKLSFLYYILKLISGSGYSSLLNGRKMLWIKHIDIKLILQLGIEGCRNRKYKPYIKYKINKKNKKQKQARKKAKKNSEKIKSKKEL